LPIEESSNRKVELTDAGLHLIDSILWLDATPSADLSFLSSVINADQLGPFKVAKRPQQVIATEETLRLLELKSKKPNGLVCQYNRPFSIGRLKMELLPSGSVLGGASLYVEHGKERILYAPYLLPQKSSTVRQMQLKKANVLIIGAFHPDVSASMPNRRREKDRLISSAKSHISEGRYPVIYCHEFPIAQELTKELADADIPIAVHSSIYKINRIYEQFGSKLGEYSLFSPKWTKNKLLILPMPRDGRPAVRSPVPNGPIFYVEKYLTSSLGPSIQTSVEERFFVSDIADLKEIREVISVVNPKEVYVIGPYAKQYCEELRSLPQKIRPLYPNGQTCLF
jgi:putative mRNA 3-end processing factor